MPQHLHTICTLPLTLRCESEQLTHNLTVIFFSRTYLRHREGETGDSRARQSSAVHVDSDGRVFEDHYKIVVENETGLSSWDSLIHRMKKGKNTTRPFVSPSIHLSH